MMRQGFETSNSLNVYIFHLISCCFQINAYLDDLAKKYPTRVTVETLGTTEHGRKIKVINISSNGGKDTNKPVIVCDAGVHTSHCLVYDHQIGRRYNRKWCSWQRRLVHHTFDQPRWIRIHAYNCKSNQNGLKPSFYPSIVDAILYLIRRLDSGGKPGPWSRVPHAQESMPIETMILGGQILENGVNLARKLSLVQGTFQKLKVKSLEILFIDS